MLVVAVLVNNHEKSQSPGLDFYLFLCVCLIFCLHFVTVKFCNSGSEDLTKLTYNKLLLVCFTRRYRRDTIDVVFLQAENDLKMYMTRLFLDVNCVIQGLKETQRLQPIFEKPFAVKQHTPLHGKFTHSKVTFVIGANVHRFSLTRQRTCSSLNCVRRLLPRRFT